MPDSISISVPIEKAQESIVSSSVLLPSELVHTTSKPSFGLGSSVAIDPIAAPLLPSDPIGDPKAPQTSKLTKESRGALLLNIATNLQKHFSFARDKALILYVYEQGVFLPTAEDLINRAIKVALTQRSLLHRWDAGMCKHVCNFILVDCPAIPEHPPANLINMKNGMLDTNSKILLPHSPIYLSYVQLPIDYDPLASSLPWEQFVSEVFPADCQDLAWEITGWLIRPLLFIQKAIVLVGEGSNGKSTFLNGIKALLGESNFSATSIQTLQQNRFAAHTLMGKLANICSDLPDKRLEDSDIFKALTGNDGIQVEVKHGERFNLKPFARLIFSANNPPSSRDASTAYFRRWVIVPFPHEFRPGTPGFKSPDEIEALLFNPLALSGFFNRALAASLALESRKYFLTPESSTTALSEFISVSSPIHRWVEECVSTESTTNSTPKDLLVRSYNSWRKRNGYGNQGITPMVFFKELRRAVGKGELIETRKGPQGKQVRHIQGIELKEDITDFDLHVVGGTW